MKHQPTRRQAITRLAWGATAMASSVFMPGIARGGNKVMRIVVPFPPGGSTDLLARRLGDELSQSLGHTVIVENRPGAGGTVGAQYVAKANPDGMTLLLGVTGSNAIAQALYPNLPYNVINDFAPVSMLVSAPLVVAVNPEVNAATLEEFVALAKGQPDTITFGSPGNGTSMHLTGEMFMQASQTKLVHVPYRGSASMVSDLMGGQIQSTFGDLLVLQPHIDAGKIRPLAVTSLNRNAIIPSVPTVAEIGYSGFEALSWQALFAPAGTPGDVIENINAAVAQALTTPSLKDYFAERGFLVEGTSVLASKDFIKREVDKWSTVVKASNAQLG